MENVNDATALELREVLARIAAMPPDDGKALAGWLRFKEAAPPVWDMSKEVIATVVGEVIKARLGL